MNLLKKPVFWIVILLLLILTLLIFILWPSTSIKNKNTSSQKISSEPTPRPKPGSCKFLIEKYCNKGHLAEVDIRGEKYKVVGFRLPAGTEIISPFDAEASGATLKDHPLKGNMVLVFKKGDHSETVTLIGDIRFHGRISWEFPKGDVVATIEGEGITNIDNYNLLIFMTKKNENGKFETNTKMLNDLFPEL
jgi:hypothetical protein